MKALILACICLLVPITASQAADQVQESIRLQTQAGRDAVQSQQQVDQLHADKQRLLEEYRSVEIELRSLKQYNGHMQKMVTEQNRKIDSIQQQMDEINVTHREVVPLMARMVDTLAQFVSLDIPFLPDERRQRISSLENLLDQPDVSVAEKYRRVMEAYQVEAEYGRTMEAYRGNLRLGEQQKTVDFLRVGRLGLVYRSLDGHEMAFWHPSGRSWAPLEDEYQNSVAQGFRMARKQVTPDLLKLPVSAPEKLE